MFSLFSLLPFRGFRSWGPWRALAVFVAVVGLWAGAARAGDPIAGMALFNNIPDSVISCGNATCHGPNPNDNVNGLQKAGNNGGVILTAIKSGVTQMMFLNGLLNPFQLDDIAAYLAPQPVLSAEAIDFAPQAVGTGSVPQAVTLQNPGGVNLIVTSLVIAGANASDFALGGDCGQGSVLQSTTIARAGGQCSIGIRFQPTAPGSRSASVTLTYAGTTTFPSTQTILLTGVANVQLLPQATLSGTALDFGETRVGDASLPAAITLGNRGTGPLTLGSLTLTGAAAEDFRLAGSCVGLPSVAPGQQCTIEILFAPSDLELRTATLKITHNASGSPSFVALSGIGITFACTPPAPAVETQTLACPAGQTGSVTQTRTYYCFDRAWIPDPWITIANSCHVGVASPDLALTEFFNVGLVHYFMTGEAAEGAAIDRGDAGPGWQRTRAPLGRVWSNGTESAGLVPVCRFYGNPARGADGARIGPNSHFYTAEPAECASVKDDPGWIFEGEVFRVLPAAGGTCAQGTVPMLRAYNGRFAQDDSNHRYAIDPATITAMVEQGWSAEGVVFCVGAP
jgi:mono/diheme cytochrome c family protein